MCNHRRDNDSKCTHCVFPAGVADRIPGIGARQAPLAGDHGMRSVDAHLVPAPEPQDQATAPVDLDGLENREFWSGYWDNGLVGTALYFLPHLAAMPERTGAVLTALAQARQGGVLFHCLAGRDRTGMISMVLLSLA
ncbi:MAG: protein-tyrosine phosphatase, partial [Actinomycetota bacterium]|nr:protein-tyrosine phosphatase [Actinomycetota bacterium]